MTDTASPSFTLSAQKRALLEARRRAAGLVPTDHGIPRRGDDGPAALSFAQQRLWFLDQLVPNSPSYNVPHLVRITGALDEAALRTALAAIEQRHAALRTTFVAAAGQPTQVVHPPQPADGERHPPLCLGIGLH